MKFCFCTNCIVTECRLTCTQRQRHKSFLCHNKTFKARQMESQTDIFLRKTDKSIANSTGDGLNPVGIELAIIKVQVDVYVSCMVQ